MASRPRATDLTPADSGGVLEPSAGDTPKDVLDLLASFQEALVTYLIAQTAKAARNHGARSIAMSGGVACNSRLREALRDEAVRLRVPAFYPSPILTTDNAAMIAAAGYHHLVQGRIADLSLNADPAARL
jgi:N6-L-threonylcarbamoyladenine synthase